MNLTDTTLRKLILEEIKAIFEVEDVYGNKRDLVLTDEPSQQHKTSQAVDTFNKFYRSLEPDTRYFFLEWLRTQLIKRLTQEEIMTLTSQITSASKGNSEPKNPNKK